MNKPAPSASLRTWRCIRMTTFLAYFISPTSFVTTKREKRLSCIARQTRHTLVSADYTVRATGYWGGRLAWSTVQLILPSRNIGWTRQRHALFFSSAAGGAWLVFKRATR